MKRDLEALQRFINCTSLKKKKLEYAREQALAAKRSAYGKNLEAQMKAYNTPRKLAHLFLRGKGRINRTTFNLSMLAIVVYMIVMYAGFGVNIRHYNDLIMSYCWSMVDC